jgi:hypothetical protein
MTARFILAKNKLFFYYVHKFPQIHTTELQITVTITCFAMHEDLEPYTV